MGGDGGSRRHYRRQSRGGRSSDHRRSPLHARGQLLYYSAERFIPPSAEKMAMYRKALRAYHAAMERLYPEIERAEVPYEGTSLPAYFVRGAGSGRRPTVVLFDGMDNAKEMSVIFAGLDFAKRGINTLAIDGPGQAEALRLRSIHSRHD